MVVLDAQQHDFYRQQGYVIVKRAIPMSYINRIKTDVQEVFRLVYEHTALDTPDLRDEVKFAQVLSDLFVRNFDAYRGAAMLCNHLPSLHHLASSPWLHNWLEHLGLMFPTICARPLMWFHSPLVAKTERYHRLPPHQDWSNMQGSLDGVVVWLPLVEVTPDMGPLQIVPESHRMGLRPFRSDSDRDYALSIQDLFTDDEFHEVHVQPGDCLIFSAFLVHRSGSNTSPRIRWTVNFRFNNAKEESFVKRHFMNPFLYQAPTTLVDGFVPTPDDVAHALGIEKAETSPEAGVPS